MKFMTKKCAEVLEAMGADIIEEHVLPEHFSASIPEPNIAGAVQLMGSWPRNLCTE